MELFKNNYSFRLSRNTLKFVAFVSMLIDHFGMIFFPYKALFRVIGRISFPIFAYLIADAVDRSSNPWKMICRLFTFMVISQIPFLLAVYDRITVEGLNIFATLLLGFLVCLFLKTCFIKGRIGILCGFIFTFFACFVGQIINIEYGAYGILLIIGFYVLSKTIMYRKRTLVQRFWLFAWLYASGIFLSF